MRKGSHHTPEAREKTHQALLGRHHSPKTREKMSGEKNHNFGKQLSPETKEKLRQANLGTQHTPATREKMRQAHLGEKNHNFGTHPSPATIEKRRQAQLGEKNHNWHGGSSFEPYSSSWTEALKESIRIRDHHTCQLCGRPQAELRKKLHVHHIDYDKKNLDPKNLISLCHSCHSKTNHNREEWKIFFQD